MIYRFNFEKISQSDLFEKIEFSCENNIEYFSILLNPECDLVLQPEKLKPKVSYLKFAAIIPCDFIFNNVLSTLKITKNQRKGEEYIDGESYDDFIHLVRNFLTGSIYQRYFYLPPFPSKFSHSVIDFQLIEIKKASKEVFSELLNKKIGGIRSSWKEAIPVRYSTYSSRIGVSDYDDSFIEELLSDLSINLKRSS